MEKKKVSLGARIKESIRKFIVSLKHRPHNIPLVMLVITFLYYALHLTTISDTTAKINMVPMGLCGFAIMLFSMLSMVCFGNAFPHRKPVNKPMLILMFVMFAIVIGADVAYSNTVIAAVNGNPDPQAYVNANPYVYNAVQYLQTHMVLMIISIALIVLLPVYSKLIRKINTSIEVEAGEEMGALQLSGED